MIVAGIDIGAGTTKAVIMDNGRLLASEVVSTCYILRKHLMM